MRKKFLSNPDYNFAKINNASTACGPMVKWAIAQINYADMLKRVDPLRNELKSLESQADENKHRAQEIIKVGTRDVRATQMISAFWGTESARPGRRRRGRKGDITMWEGER